MTTAVCFKCGAMKFGAFTECENCKCKPQTEEDFLLSMAFSDKCMAKDDLPRVAEDIRNGKPIDLPAGFRSHTLKMIRTIMPALKTLSDKHEFPVPGKDAATDQSVPEEPGKGKDLVERSKLRRDGSRLYEIDTGKPFTGRVVDYYPNGQKKNDSDYRDAVVHGQSTYWFPNGQKHTHTKFLNGKHDGKALEWFDNGQLRQEVEWRNGKFHGIFNAWYENGQRSLEAVYRDHRRVSYKGWDRLGNLIKAF